jgi:preprotein translocase subunit SecA
MVTRSIETAQRKVEARNFDIRKQLLEYDDVANEQRKEIYRLRSDVLESADPSEMVTNLRHGFFTDLFRGFVPEDTIEEQWDVASLERTLKDDWQIELPIKVWLDQDKEVSDTVLLERLLKATDQHYEAKRAAVDPAMFVGLERSILLNMLDQHWREHLAALDHLRQGIHLRGYAQKQPKQEYKREAFELFGLLLDRVRADVVRFLMSVKIQTREEIERTESRIEQEAERRVEQAQAQHAEFASAPAEAEAEEGEGVAVALAPPPPAPVQQPVRRFGEKIGRNDPCPCGSGKKFKVCHGKVA